MDILAIIPVKSFGAAKTRLRIRPDSRRRVCSIMLNEVLGAAASSGATDTLVVTGDEEAARIATKWGAGTVRDESESGVNNAVSLADKSAADYETSIVLPQDIPLVEPGDIDAVLQAARRPGALIVPSRRLDGTNALVRTPPHAFGTHYDEDSYNNHTRAARATKTPATLAFLRNIMIDVDTLEDLEYAMQRSAKPGLADKLRGALG